VSLRTSTCGLIVGRSDQSKELPTTAFRIQQLGLGFEAFPTITEGIRFLLQTQLLNSFNHPTFTLSSLGVLSNSFGQSTDGNRFADARRIEFRANIEF
jgi:hypothetical protein